LAPIVPLLVPQADWPLQEASAISPVLNRQAKWASQELSPTSPMLPKQEPPSPSLQEPSATRPPFSPQAMGPLQEPVPMAALFVSHAAVPLQEWSPTGPLLWKQAPSPMHEWSPTGAVRPSHMRFHRRKSLPRTLGRPQWLACNPPQPKKPEAAAPDQGRVEAWQAPYSPPRTRTRREPWGARYKRTRVGKIVTPPRAPPCARLRPFA
jgi:hypothetical protein